MKRPLFSILVPTYNQAPYLGTSLDSLLAQTFPDWEAIVVNDGSTDSTAEVLADYGKEDERFRIFHKDNGGPGSALNMGLEHARGEWICWLSSDDFFEPDKLRIHYDWITKHPDGRFFFTHFKEFNEVTGTLSDPPLWSPIPERPWQVLGMLHHTYVHGNSICVHRQLWSQAGSFDTELRYGQDYDMWLRLAALSPAIFIPERTCVTRVNPLQMTHGFPEALFFDCAKAGIKFLNQHNFPQLFPVLDLSNPRMARRALRQALQLAHNPYSFIYRLGAHPLLLFRIIEWAWADNVPPQSAAYLRRLFRRRAREVSRQYPDTALGFLWKIAAIESELRLQSHGKSLSGIGNQSLSATAIGEAEYWRLKAMGQPEATPLRRYLEQFQGRTLPDETPAAKGEIREVLIILHAQTPGTNVGDGDTLSQLIRAAKSFMRAGVKVAVIRLGESGIEICDDEVLVLGAPDKDSLARALKSAGPLDTVIETPHAEIIRLLSARRALVCDPGLKLSAISTNGSGRSADVDMILSDSEDWPDMVEKFATVRPPGTKISAYLQRRMDQVKRKVRNIARL